MIKITTNVIDATKNSAYGSQLGKKQGYRSKQSNCENILFF
jgi:hypothetical protein